MDLSRGLGDVYKRQAQSSMFSGFSISFLNSIPH
jgi:hypothetical protein